MREVHAQRLARRRSFIDDIPFSDRGIHYRNHAESHDLMYEYLEYYAYRWYFTAKPVDFDCFHQNLLKVYQQMGQYNHKNAGIKGNELVAYPFIQLAARYHKSTLKFVTQL